MRAKYLLQLLGALLIWLSFVVSAQAGWTPQAKDAVNRFLKSHPSLEGRDYSVQWTEPRGVLPACDKLPRVNLQSRDRAWGKIFLSLNCEEGRPWVRPVSVYVAVKGRYLVANQALRKGQALSVADLQWAEGDLTKLGDILLDDPEQVKNMELLRPLQAGTPRTDQKYGMGSVFTVRNPPPIKRFEANNRNKVGRPNSGHFAGQRVRH